jgi:hypothetical protein
VEVTVRGGENARQTRYLPCFFRRTAKCLFAVRFFFVMRPIKNALDLHGITLIYNYSVLAIKPFDNTDH